VSDSNPTRTLVELWLVCRFCFDDSLLAMRSVNAFLAGRTARAQRAAEERAEP
jgi:hypothetical protein